MSMYIVHRNEIYCLNGSFYLKLIQNEYVVQLKVEIKKN